MTKSHYQKNISLKYFQPQLSILNSFPFKMDRVNVTQITLNVLDKLEAIYPYIASIAGRISDN